MDIYDADGLLDRVKVTGELDKIIAPYRMTPTDRERIFTLAEELAKGQTEYPS